MVEFACLFLHYVVILKIVEKTVPAAGMEGINTEVPRAF